MELQVVEQNAIADAFASQGGTKGLFEKIATEARSIIFDMSVKKERDALKSFAYNLARTKTTVDNYGKELVAEIKKKSSAIDADRKFWRDSMDSLQAEVRKPLTDFENAEKERVAKHEDAIQFIKDHAPAADATALKLKGNIAFLENLNIDSRYEEYEEQAKLAKFETLEKLRTALAAREKYEAEQAELERFRAAEQERLQREHEERIAAQAAEKARIEAEQKAKAEIENAEREKRESAEREARLQAEKEAALLREEQLKQQAIEREKLAEIQKQQAIEAERKRIETEQAAKAEAEQQAEQARLANVEHMRSINSEILNKLMEIGLDEGQGKEVITAIAKNQVPYVSIKY